MTNAEKFKEVFGFKPDESACLFSAKVCETLMGDNHFCPECPLVDWWDKEYKACFTLREDL